MDIQSFLEILRANRTELEALAAQALKPLTYRERQRIYQVIGEFFSPEKTTQRIFHADEAGRAVVLWQAGEILKDEAGAIIEMQRRREDLGKDLRLPGLPSSFPNAYGVYRDQERIEIPTPKTIQVKLIIRLALVPCGKWRYSTTGDVAMGAWTSGISVNSPGFASREEALTAATRETRIFMGTRAGLEKKQARAVLAAINDYLFNVAPQLSLF